MQSYFGYFRALFPGLHLQNIGHCITELTWAKTNDGSAHRTKEQPNNDSVNEEDFDRLGLRAAVQTNGPQVLVVNDASAPPASTPCSLRLRARVLGDSGPDWATCLLPSQERMGHFDQQLQKRSVQCGWVGGNRSLQRLSWGWTGCRGVQGSYFRSRESDGWFSPSVEWPYSSDLTLAT